MGKIKTKEILSRCYLQREVPLSMFIDSRRSLLPYFTLSPSNCHKMLLSIYDSREGVPGIADGFGPYAFRNEELIVCGELQLKTTYSS
ncbi:hypothetical protein M8C21_032857 [Ambrosia artemisiifolia]|uniref:Uncharacterized protein n=1 Tax=Ambrosia artemisiifolia TaxID=4212 RepID=A0AAD5CDI2_AMBAR|nr:hypothetical protein M8C21_032857 [Ambrosia artemisiifolia]